MKLDFTIPAQADVRKITTWIAEENPVRAESFRLELIEASEGICHFPHSHMTISHYNGHPVRRKNHGNYLIFYRVVADRIQILRILHGAQDYADLF